MRVVGPIATSSSPMCRGWRSRWQLQLEKAIRESLRVAPVCYIMAPWLYGGKAAPVDWDGVQIRVDWDSVRACYQPGIHHPVLFVRYLRNRDITRGAR